MASAGRGGLAFNVWNVVGYQAGWFACVLGAAHGQTWVGPLTVAALCAIHLTLVPQRLREAGLLALCGLFGWGVDSAQAYWGVFAFPNPGALVWLAPLWLVAIWVIFSTTLHGCLAWMQGRYLLGAGLGAVGGPLAYWAGQRLGAVQFGPGLVRDLAIIGIVWAAATPALLGFAKLTGTAAP